MPQTSFIIDTIQVAYDLSALAQKLRLRSGVKIEDRLAKLAHEAARIARPKAAFKISAVECLSGDNVLLDGHAFASPLLKEKLTGLTGAFPYLATSGTELAEWAHSHDTLDQILASALSQEALGMARAALENFIVEKYGIPQISAMNPGSLPIWPISQQEPLFRLLSPLDEQIGITILPSFMMKPEHSVSGIFFQTDAKFHNCQLCPRADCPNRRTPYIGEA